MHIMELLEPVDLRAVGYPFMHSGRYVVEDINAFDHAVKCARGKVRVAYIELGAPLDMGKDYNGKRILVIRPGGFGDLLFATPAMREIKRRWPGAHISVASFQKYGVVLENLAYVDEIVRYPIPINEMGYDHVITLENVMEAGGAAKEIHAVDIVGRRFGFDELPDKKMEYAPRERELAFADGAYPRNQHRRVGIQLSASSKARTYDIKLTSELTRLLVQKGWEVFLFGRPGELKEQSGRFVRNLTIDGISFRQAMAVLSGCDAVIGPDSALVHIGGALNIPTVALYGPFPWKLRTLYAESILALSGTSGCDVAPCQFHGNWLSPDFPQNGPCVKSGRCELLASITPKQIVDKLIAHYEKQ